MVFIKADKQIAYWSLCG